MSGVLKPETRNPKPETLVMYTILPIADGTEEMEAVIVADVLRRAGWKVDVVSLEPSSLVTASRGIRLVPDLSWDEVDWQAVDLLVLPGGAGGTERLMKDERVLAQCRLRWQNQQWLAAVCAAPLILKAAGILDGQTITSHPSVANELREVAEYVEDDVVVSGRLVTSRGPGTSFAFALELVRRLDHPEKAHALAGAMVCPKSG